MNRLRRFAVAVAGTLALLAAIVLLLAVVAAIFFS